MTSADMPAHRHTLMKSNETICLRALEPGDVDRLYLWENDPEMRRHGAATAPWSRHQLWEYANNYDADPLRSGQLRLMIEKRGKPLHQDSRGNGSPNQAENVAVGCVDLYDIDTRNRHAFVGIMIAREHRRNGYASEAMLQLADYCLTSLGLHSLVAVVAADNTPSIRLFTRCGFTLRGTLAHWLRLRPGVYSDAAILQFGVD
ncbi:MAG: GNAT family N-acetyltransferase [Muribaculaceae bacterium]|nr:GNAT family N-acetyltransferase [Muribaculaceae bacterium]